MAAIESGRFRILTKGQMAIEDEPYHSRVQYDGPGYDEASVELAQVVPVHQLPPISSFGIKSHGCGISVA